MASKKVPRDFDPEEINKCTLCNFSSNYKSRFQRHLINRHGIKLKGFEGFLHFNHRRGQGPFVTPVGYGIDSIDNDNERYENRVPKRRCPKCNKICEQMKYFKSHVALCGTEALHKCPKCTLSFEKVARLNKHLQVCGREKDVVCQLCEFKSFTVKMMIPHYLNKHNLICTKVEDPDFDQVLRGTPYILERPVELEELPSTSKVAKVGNATTKKKKLFTCEFCKKEFTKLRFLNQHKKSRCKILKKNA